MCIPWIIFLVWHIVSMSRNNLWGRYQSSVNYGRDMLVLGGNVLLGDSVEVERAALNPGVSIFSGLLSPTSSTPNSPTESNRDCPPRFGLYLTLHFQSPFLSCLYHSRLLVQSQGPFWSSPNRPKFPSQSLAELLSLPRMPLLHSQLHPTSSLTGKFILTLQDSAALIPCLSALSLQCLLSVLSSFLFCLLYARSCAQ